MYYRNSQNACADGTDAQNATVSKARKMLEGWLNKNMKIKLSDGRTLIGIRNVMTNRYKKCDD